MTHQFSLCINKLIPIFLCVSFWHHEDMRREMRCGHSYIDQIFIFVRQSFPYFSLFWLLKLFSSSTTWSRIKVKKKQKSFFVSQ